MSNSTCALAFILAGCNVASEKVWGQDDGADASEGRTTPSSIKSGGPVDRVLLSHVLLFCPDCSSFSRLGDFPSVLRAAACNPEPSSLATFALFSLAPDLVPSAHLSPMTLTWAKPTAGALVSLWSPCTSPCCRRANPQPHPVLCGPPHFRLS